jgi:hypothetical protein
LGFWQIDPEGHSAITRGAEVRIEVTDYFGGILAVFGLTMCEIRQEAETYASA